MLHPLMPFITEELWAAMGERPYELVVAKWPDPQAEIDPHAKAEMEWLITLVSETRSARTSINVPPAARTDLWVLAEHVAAEGPLHSVAPTSELVERVERNREALARMARLNYVTFFNTGVQFDLRSGERFDRTTSERSIADPGIQVVAAGNTYFLPLQGLVDFEAEKARLSRAVTVAEKERDSLANRLANPAFTERAKPEAVEKARADHEAKSAEADRLRAALERLG
jgi:valyl-tRNA synthetase